MRSTLQFPANSPILTTDQGRLILRREVARNADATTDDPGGGWAFPLFTVVALRCGEHATPDLDAREPMRALLEVRGEGS
jgi:hypothetical protein